ncbi:E3 RID-beta [Human mastadenovirus B]|uniref:E3 RID-beta n=1 Tax=Human mastadenovirus B TaxID=108098 RepID=T1UH80_9ADEN|nr:E3 RID-beta [Human mastadenovirus B]
MQAILPVFLLLLLPYAVSTPAAYSTPPEHLRKCKFQQPWSFLACYREKSEIPPNLIMIAGIINIICCTIISFLIYPLFDFGWNAPNAHDHPQDPEEHIPLQNMQHPIALIDYESEPQPPLLPAISYFNLTGGDD